MSIEKIIFEIKSRDDGFVKEITKTAKGILQSINDKDYVFRPTITFANNSKNYQVVELEIQNQRGKEIVNLPFIIPNYYRKDINNQEIKYILGVLQLMGLLQIMNLNY